MNNASIRYRTLAALACAPLLLAAVPASADVIEIGTEGAYWIARGTQQNQQEPVARQGTAQEQGAQEVQQPLPAADIPVEMPVPEGSVIDPEEVTLKLPAPFREDVIMLAQRFDLSPALLEALVWQESRWRTNAVSPVGARGLAQLMPGTARYLGVDPDDPRQNLEGGARYLREQLDRFGGDLEKALAAYNAGPGRVQKAGGIPRIRETQLYVAAIMCRLSNHSRGI